MTEYIHTFTAGAWRDAGDPASETTQRPLVSSDHRASIERYVQFGLDEGGRLLRGGTRPSGSLFDKGSYYLPWSST